MTNSHLTFLQKKLYSHLSVWKNTNFIDLFWMGQTYDFLLERARDSDSCLLLEF